MSGDKIGDAGNFVQYWKLVSNSGKRRLLEGTIEKLKKNSGGPFDDDDWNIYVMPYPAYGYLRQNSADEWNEDDMIELEVRGNDAPEFDLRDLFAVGDSIQAEGYWVEDFGHWACDFDQPASLKPEFGGLLGPYRGKTELHPLHVIVRGNTSNPTFRIMAFRDMSERFDVSDHQSYCRTIRLDGQHSSLPAGVGNKSVACDVQVIRELSYIDVVASPSFFGRESRIFGGLDATNQQIELEINTRKPSKSPTGARHSPIYRGDFARFVDPLLKVATTSQVENHPQISGSKRVRVDVEAEMLNPSGQSLKRYDWHYRRTGAAANELVTSEGTAQKIGYQLIYCPRDDHSDTEFPLRAMASSDGPNECPGVGRTTTGIGGPYSRTFVGGSATVFLPRSKLDLKITELTRSVPAGTHVTPAGPQRLFTRCVYGYEIGINRHVVPGVGSTQEIYATVLKDSTGHVLLQPVRRLVPTDGSWANDTAIGHGISIACPDDSHVKVKFDAVRDTDIQAGVAAALQATGSADGVLIRDPKNYSVVSFDVELATELGESFAESTGPLSFRGAIGSRSSLFEVFDDLTKYELAAAALADRGLATPKPGEDWPPGTLSGWPPVGLESVGSTSGGIGTEDHRWKSATSITKRVMKAKRQLLAHGALTRNALSYLEHAALLGSALSNPIPDRREGERPGGTLLPRRAMVRGDRIELEGVVFRSRSSQLAAGSLRVLREWASAISQLADRDDPFKVVVECYTTRQRLESESRRLTRRRAMVIERELRRQLPSYVAVSSRSQQAHDPLAAPLRAAANQRAERVEVQVI